MKRDLDLARQLLFDIEARGAECSFGALHAGANGDTVRNGHDSARELPREWEFNGFPSEVTRYHVRLLIDGGFVKEVDRTTAGVLCVRLTNAGHELLELSRSDVRWRDAKACCLETTGGLSLTVVRTILTKWAVESAGHGYRPRRYATGYRPYYHRVEPRRRYDGARYDAYRYDAARYDYAPVYEEDDARFYRTRPTDYRETYRESWVRPTYERDYVVRDVVRGDGPAYETEEPTVGVSLPVSLI